MAIDPALYLDDLEYIPASHMTYRRNAPDVIVIHTMESPERSGAARGSASYHANPFVTGSAHIHIDDTESVRGVPDDHAANGAAGGINWRAVHIECAGRAAQTPAEWDDDFSRAVLDRAAHTAAAYCIRYGIPAVKLTPDDIRAGRAGICGHIDATNAGQVTGGHWDPGPAFPWATFMQTVTDLVGDEMTDADLAAIRKIVREEIAAQWADGNPDGVGRRAVAEQNKRAAYSYFRSVVLKPRKK